MREKVVTLKWKPCPNYQIANLQKYVGVCLEDLLDIYILFIRSVTEYCSVAFHSSLTHQQSDKLEKIQKTCLKVIMGEMYVGYSAALEMCGLEILSERRERKDVLTFH